MEFNKHLKWILQQHGWTITEDERLDIINVEYTAKNGTHVSYFFSTHEDFYDRWCKIDVEFVKKRDFFIVKQIVENLEVGIALEDQAMPSIYNILEDRDEIDKRLEETTIALNECCDCISQQDFIERIREIYDTDYCSEADILRVKTNKKYKALGEEL